MVSSPDFNYCFNIRASREYETVCDSLLLLACCYIYLEQKTNANLKGSNEMKMVLQFWVYPHKCPKTGLQNQKCTDGVHKWPRIPLPVMW